LSDVEERLAQSELALFMVATRSAGDRGPARRNPSMLAARWRDAITVMKVDGSVGVIPYIKLAMARVPANAAASPIRGDCD